MFLCYARQYFKPGLPVIHNRLVYYPKYFTSLIGYGADVGGFLSQGVKVLQCCKVSRNALLFYIGACYILL